MTFISRTLNADNMTPFLRVILCVITSWFLLASCNQNNQEMTYPEINEIMKIDFHTHYKYPRSYLDSLFNDFNLRAVLIDVSIMTDSALSRRWNEQSNHKSLYPDLFFLCTSFEGSNIDDPDYSNNVIEQIKKDISSGAVMVKVWKNFGMVTKDSSGSFIQIDDHRLQPIWDFLTDRGIPVIAHIGEPIQAWRPLDDPKNPHFGYYSNHPEYHAYIHPEIPQWETIIDARDRWIEKNPELTIIGAHMGSMSHDVDLVAERLEKYPNFYVETAARFGDLAGQDSRKVRSFFHQYQDRILFGTDYANSLPEDQLDQSSLSEEKKRLESNYQLLWNYTSTTDSLIIRNQNTRGLGLEKDILQKFYGLNALRVLGISG